MDNLQFKNLSLEYCQQVFDIEVSSIEVPWTLSQIKELIYDEKAVARVGVVDNKVVCYYSFYVICDEGNINNLAVRKDVRGQGIGKFMLQDMIDIAKERKISALTLEVNANNLPAISLYKKSGFLIEGKRNNFYGGKDDALIMWKRDII